MPVPYVQTFPSTISSVFSMTLPKDTLEIKISSFSIISSILHNYHNGPYANEKNQGSDVVENFLPKPLHFSYLAPSAPSTYF